MDWRLLAFMAMDGRYLEHLRALPRKRAREAVSQRLETELPSLSRLPAVAEALASLGLERTVLVRYTFDEPLIEAGEAQVQFTYHLGDPTAAPGAAYQEEVRGSGIAFIDATGAMRFEDVDAEISRLVDDAEIPADD